MSNCISDDEGKPTLHPQKRLKHSEKWKKSGAKKKNSGKSIPQKDNDLLGSGIFLFLLLEIFWKCREGKHQTVFQELLGNTRPQCSNLLYSGTFSKSRGQEEESESLMKSYQKSIVINWPKQRLCSMTSLMVLDNGKYEKCYC